MAGVWYGTADDIKQEIDEGSSEQEAVDVVYAAPSVALLRQPARLRLQRGNESKVVLCSADALSVQSSHLRDLIDRGVRQEDIVISFDEEKLQDVDLEDVHALLSFIHKVAFDPEKIQPRWNVTWAVVAVEWNIVSMVEDYKALICGAMSKRGKRLKKRGAFSFEQWREMAALSGPFTAFPAYKIDAGKLRRHSTPVTDGDDHDDDDHEDEDDDHEDDDHQPVKSAKKSKKSRKD